MKSMNTIQKIGFATLFTFTFSFAAMVAQTDTMYVMKSGEVIGKYNVETEIDSVLFYQPETQSGNSFTDSRDGYVYQTVSIGDQEWMAENLKYLPSVAPPVEGSLTTPYYYVNDYDGGNVAEAKATANYGAYGVLYNWPAAMGGETSSNDNPSGVQGVCPDGWHLPSDAEWIELNTFLGGSNVAGGKLKETGTAHWIADHPSATNETGFTARPGGARQSNGGFSTVGMTGSWWSATEYYANSAWRRYVSHDNSNVNRFSIRKEGGYSVRCVKD